MGEGPLELPGDTLPAPVPTFPGDSFSFILLTNASNCFAANFAFVLSLTGFLASASKASCCCSSSDCSGDELLRGAGRGLEKSLVHNKRMAHIIFSRTWTVMVCHSPN